MTTHENAFIELVAAQLGSLDYEELMDAFANKFGAGLDEADFELFLWSLAHRSRIDSEELLRRLGERWIAEFASHRFQLQPCQRCTLKALTWLSRHESALREAPLPGFDVFTCEVIRESKGELRLVCSGPRRCVSFLEGAARALAALNGESIRYLRSVKGAHKVELIVRVIG